jgi:hypothetical protein
MGMGAARFPQGPGKISRGAAENAEKKGLGSLPPGAPARQIPIPSSASQPHRLCLRKIVFGPVVGPVYSVSCNLR